MQERYDLIVIGSGPGGYVAAIKAAKMGMKTAIVENREIGGTCLNRGCIPTKTLMYSSHLYAKAKELHELGINYTGLSYDLNKIQDRKDQVVDKIRQGTKSLLESNGVTIMQGRATIMDTHRIRIQNQEEVRFVDTDKVLIASGSKPILPGIEGITSKNVITSDELLSQRDQLYSGLIIIGGGVIGIELATYYLDMGSKVEIIEAMDRILPNMEREVSQSIAMNLKKKGASIHTKAKVVKISESLDNTLICEYEEKNGLKSTFAEGILVAVGRQANTEGLFGPDFQLAMEGAHIKVNEKFQTSEANIYAIGDVIKGRQLAHVASAQGIAAVELMNNQSPSIHLDIIPSCIYTSPEVAVVGMQEEEAKANGLAIKVGKYPMLGNSKTILSTGERGFVKVISDAETGRIIGATLFCERATDMVGELTIAIAKGLTYHDTASVIRPHPTYEEAITEAVEDIEGMAIHLMPRKR